MSVSSTERSACHSDDVSEESARDGERVRLSLPATAAYARLARIAAARLAHRWDFAPHQVQDLRLAIDEAFILLLAGHHDQPGSIDVDYLLDDDHLSVDVTAAFGEPEQASALDEASVERFRTLAGELLSAYQLGANRVELRIDRQD